MKKSKFSKKDLNQVLLYLFITVLAIFILLILSDASRVNCEEPSPVNLVFFFSKECEHCKDVQELILEPLEELYPLKIERVDVDETEGYERLMWMEELTGDSGNEIPAVYCEGRFLSGMEEIDQELETMIRKLLDKSEKERAESEVVGLKKDNEPIRNSQKYLNKESTLLKKTVNQEPKVLSEKTGVQKDKDSDSQNKVTPDVPVYAAYFYKHGCKQCDRAFKDIRYLMSKYKKLTIREYDISDPNSKTLNEALGLLCKVPEKKRLTAPAFFIGDDYLLGESIRVRNIEGLIKKYTERPMMAPWERTKELHKKAQENIISRFYRISLPTILFAGLLDGINPCAFATIIFFISYLTYIGRRGKEILFVGGAFTFSVFITYLAVGLGFFSFIKSLSFLPIITKIVYITTAVFALVLGILSIKDYFLCRAGKLSDMTLQLPDFLKKRIHKTIKKEAKINRYLLGAIITGFIISILELACTGQVYLPTVIFVSKVSSMKAKSITYLLLYNLMFISPLCLIFVTVYKGTTSQELTTIFQKYTAWIKLGMAILFFSLATILILSLI